MAADWMASGFAFEPGEADALAAGVLTRTAWSGWHSGAPARDILEGRDPRPAQIGALKLSIDERLAVIEAPTGSGKTEAALIWASRLAEAGEVDGLYFAVPTRSAATELHARIGRLMSAHHPALKGKIVRAMPGLLDTDNPVPDYPPETWAVAAPKRTFAAPIAVGTIDQALLSIVLARHAWMRAAFLSRHLLVVDEVHASDPYMAALTSGLVNRHLALGGRALAMSATLGESALATLLGRERKPMNAAVAAPYPALRLRTGDEALPDSAGARSKSPSSLGSRPAPERTRRQRKATPYYGYEAPSMTRLPIFWDLRRAASIRCFTTAATPSRIELGLIRSSFAFSVLEATGSASLR
jgi:hypothetical protein